MTRLVSVLIPVLLLAGSASPASAQLLWAKEAPIVYGHHHVNATSIAEHKKFWVDALGGVVARIGTNNIEFIKFPNALLFMCAAQKPSGGTKGSSVDHIAFSVSNLRKVLDRVKASGARVVTATEAPANVTVKDEIGIIEGGPVSGIAYVMAPDEVKVELLEIRSQSALIVSHHVHFFGAQKEMQSWYMQTFGATAATSANPAAFVSAAFSGLVMNFSPSALPVSGTPGRALDHIGFEVKNLEAFTKKLEAQGVKLTAPYRQAPELGIRIAFVTDPWGTLIELTEGLDKVN